MSLMPEEKQIDEVLLTQNKRGELNAKIKQLKEWKSKGVYTEIDNHGQGCISLRWFTKSKINDKISIKACLSTRGFEEEQSSRADSPTCSREEVKCLFSLIPSKNWHINPTDIKQSFYKVRNQKEKYQCHHLRRRTLLKYGTRSPNLDQEIFKLCKFFEVIGVIILLVDNLIQAGKPTFSNIINKFRKTFHIGTKNSKTFPYVGINIKQSKDMSITVN